AKGLSTLGLNVEQANFFDTLTIKTGGQTSSLHVRAHSQQINLRVVDAERLGLSLDETSTQADVENLWSLLAEGSALPDFATLATSVQSTIPVALVRKSRILSHPVFNRYHSETELMRYL
ncbi:glycine dehydrogenase (aminomethyl-transferring), partial [Pseudomonas sp. F1002]|nr:glycine dehydrogenase (aminomethyl-transferring) [Pseudomonas sp. F1002]